MQDGCPSQWQVLLMAHFEEMEKIVCSHSENEVCRLVRTLALELSWFQFHV